MKIPKWKIKGQKLGYNPADKLADNITHMSGRAKGANEHAHHIVAGGADKLYKSADDALKKIKALGIDINEGANGVFMPKSSKYVTGTTPAHSKIHTEKYYKAVWREIGGLNTADDVRDKLQFIKDEIIAGRFDY